ncbi:MAG: CPBP family glutamic-type intramembrane protease, partial [Candidatus Binatia bacterium]
GFFTLRFDPTAETIRATAFVVSFIVVLGSMLTFVAPRFGRDVAGPIVTAFYVVMYFSTLSFVRRQGSFAAVGITRRRWGVAAILGFLVGGVGVLGTMNMFPEGRFVIPEWRSFVVLVATGLSVGFIEDVIFYGYFQFRLEEAFGPLVAVLGGALAWTLFHAGGLAAPGAGTFGAGPLGPVTFLANLFVSFLAIGLVVHFTGNIWAGVVQNALMGNVLINLYMLSVMPNEILIADPDALTVALLVAVLVVAGLAAQRRRLRRLSVSRLSTARSDPA